MNVLKKISCIFIKIFKRYSACILHRFCKSNIPNIILFGVLLNWLKQIVGVNPMSQIWPYFYTDVFKINLNTLTFTSSAKWHRGVRFKWGDVQNLIFTWPISPNWSEFNADKRNTGRCFTPTWHSTLPHRTCKKKISIQLIPYKELVTHGVNTHFFLLY